MLDMIAPLARTTENRANKHGEADPHKPEQKPEGLKHDELPFLWSGCCPTAGERENKNERSHITQKHPQIGESFGKRELKMQVRPCCFGVAGTGSALGFYCPAKPTKKRTQVWPHTGILTLAKSRRGCDW